MNKEFEELLRSHGAEFIRFADISAIPEKARLGFSKAIIFIIPLSKKFVLDVKNGVPFEKDDFTEKEIKCDALADLLGKYIISKGFNAFSQSEKSNIANNRYDEKLHTNTLPNKTIAVLAGMGFIGKNNLLITRDYGCALSMGTVLTDAPIETAIYEEVEEHCKGCLLCKKVCPPKAIKGNRWDRNLDREEIIDASKCNCVLKCLAHCPFSLRYELK